MRTKTRVATAITGAGAAVALLVATPGLAAAGQGAGTQDGGGNGPNQQNARQMGDCDGTAVGRATRLGQNGPGNQNRPGAGMQGRGAGTGPGRGADLTNVESGTLTLAQKTKLAALAEEEKLAHDLYVAFADKYGTPVFTQISNAETRHLAEARIVLKRYSIADPTAGQAVGTFTTSGIQQQYNKLLAQGTASIDAAYAAARTVESTDVTNLKAAAMGVTAPDVLKVYSNLLAGSQRHLAAFGG